MNEVLQINGKEGVALANRLAEISRTSPEEAVLRLMREKVARERQKARQVRRAFARDGRRDGGDDAADFPGHASLRTG